MTGPEIDAAIAALEADDAVVLVTTRYGKSYYRVSYAGWGAADTFPTEEQAREHLADMQPRLRPFRRVAIIERSTAEYLAGLDAKKAGD